MRSSLSVYVTHKFAMNNIAVEMTNFTDASVGAPIPEVSMKEWIGEPHMMFRLLGSLY